MELNLKEKPLNDVKNNINILGPYTSSSLSLKHWSLKNINLNIKIDIKKCYNFGGMFSQK
jgi:hypothetical protein